MKQTAIGKAFTELPPWAKGVVGIATLGIAVVIVRAGYIAIKTAQEKSKQNRTAAAADQGLNELRSQQIFPSYPDTQYKILADKLEQCFQGYGTCSDFSAWEAMKNDADVLKLIQAFGVRTISSGKWNPTPDTIGNLSTILADEGSSFDVINGMLAKKGIKYRF